MSEQEFDQHTLGELLLALKDGTHGTHPRTPTGVPFLSAKNIADGVVVWGAGDDCISEAEYAALNKTFSLQRDDLLLTIVGSLGRRAQHDGSKVAFQRSVAFLRPNRERLSPQFLFHVTGGVEFQRALVQRSNATAQAGVYLSEIGRIAVHSPPLPEQQKIAEILDTVDEATRKTDQIIAKLKQVKQGLLHDLLTRGIDDNGELRDPERHPEQFKDSPLGRIPKAWGVATISELCDAVVDCPHTTPVFTSEGVLVARTSHIREGRFDSTSASRVCEAEYRERVARLEPRPGDVIFTREAPVGEAFVIPPGMRICLGQRVMLLRPNSARFVGDYLVAQIYSGAVARRIDLLTGGTTNPHLNVSDVRDFRIPVPPVREQHQIAESLRALDLRLAREGETCSKLQSTKQGLAEDLLTGRVRTTNLLEPSR